MPEAATLAETPIPTQDAPAPQADEATTEQTPLEPPETGAGESAETEQRTELPEGWQDHPDIKAHRAEGYSEAQSHWQKQAERSKAELETAYSLRLRDQVAAAKADAGVAAMKEVLETVKEGFVDEADATKFLDKLLSQNADWAKVYSEAEGKKAQAMGENQGFSQASQALYEGLSKDSAEALNDFVVTNLNPKWAKEELTTAQAFNLMREKRDELLAKDIEAKVEKLVTERLEAEAKAKAKSEEPTPVAVNGHGSTAMTFEDLEHIYAQGEASPEQELRYRQMRRQMGL